MGPYVRRGGVDQPRPGIQFNVYASVSFPNFRNSSTNRIPAIFICNPYTPLTMKSKL
jgi:hypothetical protein